MGTLEQLAESVAESGCIFLSKAEWDAVRPDRHKDKDFWSSLEYFLMRKNIAGFVKTTSTGIFIFDGNFSSVHEYALWM